MHSSFCWPNKQTCVVDIKDIWSCNMLQSGSQPTAILQFLCKSGFNENIICAQPLRLIWKMERGTLRNSDHRGCNHVIEEISNGSGVNDQLSQRWENRRESKRPYITWLSKKRKTTNFVPTMVWSSKLACFKLAITLTFLKMSQC